LNISLYQKVPESYFASQFDETDGDSWSKYVKWMDFFNGYYVLSLNKRVESGDWVLFKDDGRDIIVGVIPNGEFERNYQKVNRKGD
jgi:hypothetical protein